MTSENISIEDLILKVADALGIVVHSIGVHPSGALAVYTADEGKKYVEPSELFGKTEGEVNAAILDVFRPVLPTAPEEIPPSATFYGDATVEDLQAIPGLAEEVKSILTEEEFDAPRNEPGIHRAMEDVILVNAEAFEAECRAAAVVAEEKAADTSHDSPKAKRGRKPKAEEAK